MAPLVSRLTTLVRSGGSPFLGDCIVCAAPVRESDDRMRVHGRYVHTGCAGYRLRRFARSRALGSQDANEAFTGD